MEDTPLTMLQTPFGTIEISISNLPRNYTARPIPFEERFAVGTRSEAALARLKESDILEAGIRRPSCEDFGAELHFSSSPCTKRGLAI